MTSVVDSAEARRVGDETKLADEFVGCRGAAASSMRQQTPKPVEHFLRDLRDRG